MSIPAIPETLKTSVVDAEVIEAPSDTREIVASRRGALSGGESRSRRGLRIPFITLSSLTFWIRCDRFFR